ncbi:hypothetical protein H0H93_005042 [Arthromyces matolae]|nr:hypothetical protein H0H93_005042 [Arthromyces matolae]
MTGYSFAPDPNSDLDLKSFRRFLWSIISMPSTFIKSFFANPRDFKDPTPQKLLLARRFKVTINGKLISRDETGRTTMLWDHSSLRVKDVNEDWWPFIAAVAGFILALYVPRPPALEDFLCVVWVLFASKLSL